MGAKVQKAVDIYQLPRRKDMFLLYVNSNYPDQPYICNVFKIDYKKREL